MTYIVFDLEYNQSVIQETREEACPFEIVQIGAVKLDKDFQVVSLFDRLVKPKLYHELHPFISELTNITQAQLIQAKPFTVVFDEFIEFMRSERSVLCTWGMGDMKELYRNINYHFLTYTDLPKSYINLQVYASKYLKCPMGTNVGLNNAVKMLNIPLIYEFHNALHDALYTAEIFKVIHPPHIKVKLYTPSDKTSDKNIKNHELIDYVKLFNQIEKMFRRELSAEEKSMIQLAYQMGRTQQFIKSTPHNRDNEE